VHDGLKRRIGVFGGTFDPPHHGHIAIAQEVRHSLNLDEVLMVVANDPWQKTAISSVTPAVTRLALSHRAFDSVDGLDVSDLEIRRGGASYTADTLGALSGPDCELFLVVGSDAAAGLDTWKRSDEVRSLATTVVVDRGGRQGGRPPAGWTHAIVDVPALEISSSDLRARFGSDRPVDGLLPRSVIDQIRALGLYGSGR
jgi:nicotinate-nucleotide adenylyltransferase